MNLFCIILARGGSKGLPGKNIRELGGKPLIAHSIEAALESKYVDEVFVSSDSEEILSIAKEFNATALVRPASLAQDESTSDEAILFHYKEKSEHAKYDGILLLQPTSPLRTNEDIDGAVNLYINVNNNVYSVSELEVSPYRSYKVSNDVLTPLLNEGNYSRRQDEPKTYAANGAIYIFNGDDFLKTGKLPKENITPYIMNKESSIDIDDEIDFELAQIILEKKRNK